MSLDLECVDGFNSLLVVESGAVIEFVGFGGEVDAVLGELVVNLGELAPVGSLPGSSGVFVGNEANIDLFDWVLELRHKDVALGSVQEVLLVLVYADERESNALNVQVVHSWVSEEVVGVEEHSLNSGVVKSSVGVHGQVLVLIPSVANDEAA